jgi:hypothetical protein
MKSSGIEQLSSSKKFDGQLPSCQKNWWAINFRIVGNCLFGYPLDTPLIGAVSIINAVIIDAYFNFPIGWLYAIILMLLCLHPYFNHYLPKMIIHPPGQSRTINFLYDTGFLPLASQMNSFVSIVLSVGVMIYVFFYIFFSK